MEHPIKDATAAAMIREELVDSLKARIAELETALADANHWRKRWCDDYQTMGQKTVAQFDHIKRLLGLLEEASVELSEFIEANIEDPDTEDFELVNRIDAAVKAGCDAPSHADAKAAREAERVLRLDQVHHRELLAWTDNDVLRMPEPLQDAIAAYVAAKDAWFKANPLPADWRDEGKE